MARNKEVIVIDLDNTNGKKRPAPFEIFEIILHYNGEFGVGGYVNGDVVARSWEKWQMSLTRLDLWSKKMGVKGLVMYYWKQPKLEFHQRIRPIEDNRDVTEMVRAGIKAGFVDVYVKYLSCDDVYNLVPRSGHKLELKELEDDGSVGAVEDGSVGTMEAGPACGGLLLLEWYKSEAEGQPEAVQIEDEAVDEVQTEFAGSQHDIVDGQNHEGVNKKQKTN